MFKRLRDRIHHEYGRLADLRAERKGLKDQILAETEAHTQSELQRQFRELDREIASTGPTLDRARVDWARRELHDLTIDTPEQVQGILAAILREIEGDDDDLSDALMEAISALFKPLWTWMRKHRIQPDAPELPDEPPWVAAYSSQYDYQPIRPTENQLYDAIADVQQFVARLNPGTADKAPRNRPGRKADDEAVKHDAKIAADWKQAREASRILAVSARKLWSMTFEETPALPHVKCGRLVRYPVSELQRWIASQTQGGTRGDQ
jgi:predicted DNA-binding transcriptional regulator AlpA